MKDFLLAYKSIATSEQWTIFQPCLALIYLIPPIKHSFPDFKQNGFVKES